MGEIVHFGLHNFVESPAIKIPPYGVVFRAGEKARSIIEVYGNFNLIRPATADLPPLSQTALGKNYHGLGANGTDRFNYSLTTQDDEATVFFISPQEFYSLLGRFPDAIADVIKSQRSMLESPLFPTISEEIKESDELNLLNKAHGLTSKYAGEEIGLAETTVKTHLTNLYRKLGVKTNIEAVLKSITLGLIPAAFIAEHYDMSRIKNLADNGVLTARDIQLLDELIEHNARYSSDMNISQKLGISVKSVKNRFVSIFDKLGVANRTQAGAVYLASQLIND